MTTMALSLDELYQFVSANGLNHNALGTVCLLLERLQQICSSSNSDYDDLFFKFATLLRPSLRSYSIAIRKVALRILIHFWPNNQDVEENHNAGNDKPSPKSSLRVNPIHLLYEAEQCNADFHHYKERAQLFRRLKRPTLLKQMADERWKKHQEITEKIIIDILLAQFYETFALYTPLLTEIIESYAQGSSLHAFWECYAQSLDYAWTALFTKEDPKVYFDSYRLKLLRLLCKMPAVQAELHTRYLSPKFIMLYRDEFTKSNKSSILTNKPESNTLMNQIKEIEMEAEEIETQNKGENENERVSLTSTPSHRSSAQAIKAMLNLFARFHNPSGVYLAQEIRDIYNELLLINDPEIQRAVLNCLMTYKYTWLIPYKDHLEGLLDERRLKEHLILFGVDNKQHKTNENSLSDQHRTELIPVLIRLLYGSLHTHVANRGKAKRLAIFRFLASCYPEELTIFLHLLFGPLIFDKKLEELSCKSDLVQSISINKIKSILGNLSDVFQIIGPSLDDAQLELLFGSLVLAGYIFLQQWKYLKGREQSTARLLKNVWKLFFDSLVKFFHAFQFREQLPLVPFTLFQKFIGHFIGEYNIGRNEASSNIALPISVVRLFCCWARITRFMPLLNVAIAIKLNDCVQSTTTPLALLCDQLVITSSLQSTTTDILRTIYYLLEQQGQRDTLENDDNVEMPFDLKTALSMNQNTQSDETPPMLFRTDLINSKAHLDKILIHLTRLINGGSELGSERINSQINRIPTIYFDLLSRISQYKRPEFGTLFAQTLLHYATFKSGILLQRKPQKAIIILNTLAHLSQYLENPLDSLERLSLLFSRLDGRQLREAVTRVTCSLALHQQLPVGAKKLLEHLEPLESWNTRSIDEADADRRCEALLRLHDLYEQKDVEALLDDGAAHIIPILAHSHAHSISLNSDMSLRGTAANSLRQLIQFTASSAVSSKFDSTHFLRTHLIPLTLRGLRAEESESIRHEFIHCLAALVRHFHKEKQLAPLKIFISATGPEGVVDPDLDFFGCATHIQLHRRQRAFHRIAERLNNGELSVGHSTLLRFIMPIVKPYLMETSSNKSALSDQSLHLFTALLRKLPWNKYYKVLDHYLGQLGIDESRTKGAIRVILAALDAFHFDLQHLNTETKETPMGLSKMDCKIQKKAMGNEGDDANKKEEGDGAETAKTKYEDEEAKRQIYEVVTGKLLPRLRECFHPQNSAQLQTHRHAQHHLANSWKLEDDKLMRAPLTLAAVKLLKWLPKQIADQHLHGLIHNLITLLMSRSPNIRHSARKLMEQLVRHLGPHKLPFVISEVKQLLNKGFQVHVMTVTVADLIGVVGKELSPGDLEPCLKDLMEIFRRESFSNLQANHTSTEGESIQPDSQGVPEAKIAGNKIAESMTKIGRFVANKDLLEEQILGQIHEIANASPKMDTIRKLAEWLRLLSIGMKENLALSSYDQLQWALNILHRYLPQLCSDNEKNASHSLAKKEGQLRRTNCLLLAPEPKRVGVIQRVATKSKVHIFVEFAFQLLTDQVAKLHKNKNNTQSDLKTIRNSDTDNVISDGINNDDELLTLLKQFIPLIIVSFDQKYDRIITLCLRSVLHLLKNPLFEMKEYLAELTDCFFVLLANYASMGHTGSQSNLIELQQHLFKCITQVVKDAPLAVLGASRLRLLLDYVETDILDMHKQETAFDMIKAIIGRRIDNERVNNIIEYLSETAITSTSTNIRCRCRQTVLIYLLVHPRAQRQYERWMEFFVNQCEYELEEGRLSALEMVHSIIKEFTPEANARYALFVHIKLCSRLVNDNSERCRDLVSDCLRCLLCSIPITSFNDCLAATKDWLDSSQPSISLLAWRAIAQFVSSDSPHFDSTCLRQLLKRAFRAFCIPTQTFIKQSDSLKLAYCELFKTIITRAPEELTTELFHSNGIQQSEQIQRKASRQKRSKFLRKKQSIDEYVGELDGQNWRQFFVNLEFCLTRSQYNSLLLPLSQCAGSLFNNWLNNSKCLLTIIENLNGNQQGESIDEDMNKPAELSLLCSLCLSLAVQFDPKKNRKIQQQQEQMEEDNENGGLNLDEIGTSDEHKEGTWQEGAWNNQLAEHASQSLARLMPSLSNDHFALVCKRLSKLCWAEAVKETYNARKRLCILKLVAGLISGNNKSPDKDQLGHLTSFFLPLICRELSKKSPHFTDELHSLSAEVSAHFRNRIGDREFSVRLAQCQRERTERVKERQRRTKSLFVVDPAAAIAEKQRRHDRIKRSKKRKIDEHKPHRKLKKRRTSAGK